VVKGQTRETNECGFNSRLNAPHRESVETKTDLSWELTDPEVNALFKRKWFQGYSGGNLRVQ